MTVTHKQSLGERVIYRNKKRRITYYGQFVYPATEDVCIFFERCYNDILRLMWMTEEAYANYKSRIELYRAVLDHTCEGIFFNVRSSTIALHPDQLPLYTVADYDFVKYAILTNKYSPVSKYQGCYSKVLQQQVMECIHKNTD